MSESFMEITKEEIESVLNLTPVHLKKARISA